jgi:enamine deaminase RidA (YjgF/YER057c/UK114 family)
LRSAPRDEGVVTPPSRRRPASRRRRSFATRVGDLLFLSGIPGFDAQGTLPENFEAQFANVVTNISHVLDEAGATSSDLAKVNVLLTRASEVAAMNTLLLGRGSSLRSRRRLSELHDG